MYVTRSAIGLGEGSADSFMNIGQTMPRSVRAMPLIFLPLIFVVTFIAQFGISEPAHRRLFVGGLLIGFGVLLFIAVWIAVGWQCMLKRGTCPLLEVLGVLLLSSLLFALPSGTAMYAVGEEIRTALQQGLGHFVFLGFVVGGISAITIAGYSLFAFIQLRNRRRRS
ncbi:MAG: hypothetical protein ACFLMY_11825 [Candidatus Brachytrichaceae bacterium NZ_4S206]|jgi:hypothetical protein